MNIHLIAVGNKMPSWVNSGFEDYQSRFRGELSLNLSEIPLNKRLDKTQLKSAQEKETREIINKAGSAYLITLDGQGKNYTSEALADRLRYWQENHREIALVIGAPEGLTPEIKAKAQESWSLGALTLPHPLVRIIVAEALYRAWTINQNHPYHRA